MFYYFGSDFSDCCLHLYRGKLKQNILAGSPSSLTQVFFVYLSIESQIIQWPKRCFSVYPNKDEDKNHKENYIQQASSQKFRRMRLMLYFFLTNRANFHMQAVVKTAFLGESKNHRHQKW